jgi:hypothetical protein
MRECVALSLPVETLWNIPSTFDIIFFNIAIHAILLGYLGAHHSPSIFHTLKEAP